VERQAGLLISGCGWIDGGGYEALLQQVAAFRADVLVVIGDDRLHSQVRIAQTRPPLHTCLTEVNVYIHIDR